MTQVPPEGTPPGPPPGVHADIQSRIQAGMMNVQYQKVDAAGYPLLMMIVRTPSSMVGGFWDIPAAEKMLNNGLVQCRGGIRPVTDEDVASILGIDNPFRERP